MIEFGNCPIGSLPPDLLKQALGQASREIENYTLSLILDQNLVGSGTLINVAGLDGILTAHHVADLVCKSPSNLLGLNIVGYTHQFFVPVSHLEQIEIGNSKTGQGAHLGPDLSFLRILDQGTLAILRSRKLFFHLANKTFDPFRELPLDQMQWYLAGAPDELSEHLGPPGTSQHTLKTCHFIAETTFRSLTERDSFDYIQLTLIAGEHGFPKSYGGVSGGGIWFVPLAMDPDKGPRTLSYHAPFLAGVAFYQSDLENNERIITGHGPASIYTKLTQAL